MISIIGLFVLILIIYYAILFIRRIGRPPGPFGLPWLGYLAFLDSRQPHVTLSKLSKKYGPIYGLDLGSIYTVVITESSIVREALKRNVFSGRAPLFITHGIMGGHGIICAEGPLWKDQRKLSIDCLKKLGMTKYGNERELLEKRIKNGISECINAINKNELKTLEFNPMYILHHTMGNIINDLVFGIKYESGDKTWEYLQHLQEEGVKHIGISGVVNFLPILRFLPHNRKIIKFLLDGKAKTHKIYEKIIENCKYNSMTSKANLLDVNQTSSVIELFLREKERRLEENNISLKFCSQIQLKHLLADLFGAGVDTTLTTLRWFLLYIGKNQSIQNKIRDEMNKNISNSPSLNDIDNLPYLRACIAETQRIRSVVPLGIPHGTIEDTELNGFRIPKGTMIIPLQWAIHMDDNVWIEPDRFEPNRFIDDNEQFYLPTNFMPFQTGKRICLGDDLAKKLLFLFCGNLVYEFDISFYGVNDLDMRGNCGITLTPPDYDLIFKRIIR